MYEILFQYGPLTIASINVAMALGFIAGMIFMIRFIHLKKLKLSFLVQYLVHLIAFPLIGGRLFYFFERWSFFKEAPWKIFFIWDLEFSVWGIFYGLMLTLFILTRKNREDFWGWFDAFVISGLAGLFFLHLGHFLNGSHYGKPTELPWGIAFDTYSIPFTNPIHPTQLYSALAAFLLISIANRYVKRTHLSGVAGSLAIMLYSLSAIGIDFLHGIPSFYLKINHALLALLALFAYILCANRSPLSAEFKS